MGLPAKPRRQPVKPQQVTTTPPRVASRKVATPATTMPGSRPAGSIASARSPASQAMMRMPSSAAASPQRVQPGDAPRGDHGVPPGPVQRAPIRQQRAAAAIGGEQRDVAPQCGRPGGQHEGVVRPVVRAGQQQHAEPLRLSHGRTGRGWWDGRRMPGRRGRAAGGWCGSGRPAHPRSAAARPGCRRSPSTSFSTSAAWSVPMTPVTAPSTPASPHVATVPGGGAAGCRQR